MSDRSPTAEQVGAGRKKQLAIVAGALLVVALVVFFLLTRGGGSYETPADVMDALGDAGLPCAAEGRVQDTPNYTLQLCTIAKEDLPEQTIFNGGAYQVTVVVFPTAEDMQSKFVATSREATDKELPAASSVAGDNWVIHLSLRAVGAELRQQIMDGLGGTAYVKDS